MDIDVSELKLQYEEVQQVKWATINEIFEKIDDGSFIPLLQKPYHPAF